MPLQIVREQANISRQCLTNTLWVKKAARAGQMLTVRHCGLVLQVFLSQLRLSVGRSRFKKEPLPKA